MLQTPEAVADDGLFDLTVIRKMSRLAVLLHFKVLFNGRIYKLRKTSLNRGRRIRIESSPAIAVEVAGEALGYSPFEFEIIDRAVRGVVAERFLSESAGASSGSPAPPVGRCPVSVEERPPVLLLRSSTLMGSSPVMGTASNSRSPCEDVQRMTRKPFSLPVKSPDRT